MKKIVMINSVKVLKILFLFLLGFFCSNLINFYIQYGYENPFSKNIGILSIYPTKAVPNDYIKDNDLEIYSDKIIIKIKNASIGKYAATGSMEPVLNEYSNGIRIVPSSENEINVGDIITFQDDNILVIHRVIEKGSDDYGEYFITKGDNNPVSDGKIRFKDIKYKTIGILY